jgi:hypothetical protein
MECKLIVSPEDMQDCSLPVGYKPLLLSKLVRMENSIVDYPFHPYLIDDNQQEFYLRTRANASIKVLRDFVYEQYLHLMWKIII